MSAADFPTGKYPADRSGEGHPLALLRARLSDWGDEGRLLEAGHGPERGAAGRTPRRRRSSPRSAIAKKAARARWNARAKN